MSSIVFLDVDTEDRALVSERFPQAVIAQTPRNDAELITACKDASIVSCFITSVFSASVIKRLPSLKLLCTRSVGYDHIDTAACRENGITVCNVPDYGSHVIAEHVFALLLSTLRHIHEGERRVESGVFDYHGLRGMALRGKTIGIVGTGKIGRRVAEIAHGFGMILLASDQCRTLEIMERLGVRYVPLGELLSCSDIITLHVPGTAGTRHLIDSRAFSLMKNGVIIVNTARGTLIDSSALLHALKTGKVAHALLDVLEHEGNFQQNRELIEHPNVVATPHVAFYADDAMRNMYQDSFLSIAEWMNGKEPAHVVRPLTVVCDLPPLKA
jgi:D-lactate dehydrogenase